MANIASQIKRNQRSLRERAENRQYTSAIKTYFRRLQAAVTEGDDAAADAEHHRLITLIDKAVKRGALHRNNGARKKSRAAKLRRSAVADTGAEAKTNQDQEVLAGLDDLHVNDPPVADRVDVPDSVVASVSPSSERTVCSDRHRDAAVIRLRDLDRLHARIDLARTGGPSTRGRRAWPVSRPPSHAFGQSTSGSKLSDDRVDVASVEGVVEVTDQAFVHIGDHTQP